MYMEDAQMHGGLPPRDVVAVTTVLHEFAESLGAAVDAKDHHTRQHSVEVAETALTLSRAMGLPRAVADAVHVAGHLHDVGKIGVPDAVLIKAGPLTALEWELVRRHPVIGADIVRPVQGLRECGVLEMVLYHHERFDGRGYPAGLKGRHIQLGARIITVADSLSAMLQRRPYREAMSFELACRELERHAGSQFDPEIVEVFLALTERRPLVLHPLPAHPTSKSKQGPRLVQGVADAG